MIRCQKCSGKIFVDRVFLTCDYLELYCIICGRREMYKDPENHSKRTKWIMKMERIRAKKSGNTL
jgi:DNA-directed RNA polymerase subunit RPC12/RpoP